MAVFFAVAGVRARAVQAVDGPNLQTSSEERRADEAAAAMGSAENRSDARPEAAPARKPWPCRLIVPNDLRPFLQLAWDLSPRFRVQCRKLAAAGALLTLGWASEADPSKARATLGSAGDGSVVAHVRVRPGGRTVELIAHEFEHVLERVEGVNYLLEHRANPAVRLLPGGAFETRRAIAAGRRVAEEVEQAARARKR
jgi:hypothetical protein